MHLSEAPDHQLRMFDIAARTALSPSRITRVVDDLPRAGLVVKVRCDSDGRGNFAKLTAAGLELRGKAHEPHLRRVPVRFLDGLRPEDVSIAARVVAQMLVNVEHSGTFER
jgi:DNA-binding MarR family transcriptional regulator